MTTTAVEQEGGQALRVAVVALVAGAAVAVALRVYGNQHQPAGQAITTLGFGSMIGMKVWLGSIAGVLALGQLGPALWMYGKLGRPAPRALGLVHRFSMAAADGARHRRARVVGLVPDDRRRAPGRSG